MLTKNQIQEDAESYFAEVDRVYQHKIASGENLRPQKQCSISNLRLMLAANPGLRSAGVPYNVREMQHQMDLGVINQVVDDLISKVPKDGSTIRHQVYIKVGAHVLVLDFKMNEQQKLCTVLDAATESSCEWIAAIVAKKCVTILPKKSTDENVMISQVQKAYSGCPIHSTQQGGAFSKIDAYDHLLQVEPVKKGNQGRLLTHNWDCMPPQILVNAQLSQASISQYAKFLAREQGNMPDCYMQVDEYMAKVHLENTVTKEGNPIQVNYALVDTLYQCRDNTLQFISNHDEAFLNETASEKPIEVVPVQQAAQSQELQAQMREAHDVLNTEEATQSSPQIKPGGFGHVDK